MGSEVSIASRIIIFKFSTVGRMAELADALSNQLNMFKHMEFGSRYLHPLNKNPYKEEMASFGVVFV